MITNSFQKFGPGIKCFSYGWDENGFHATAEYGFNHPRNRPMTEQEWQWVQYPPTDDLIELQALNSDEAGARLCDHCDKFHPDLKSWKDWEALCPDCVADGEEYYQTMQEEMCCG